MLLEDLRDAADTNGPPLDAETLASLDRGLADIAAERVKPLEEYKRAFGSYPKDAQEFKKAIGESLPSDYWEQSLKYQSKIGDIAEQKESIERTGLPLNHFELRSAGPDGIIGTDDDIIMRDGIFFTNSEVKKLTAVQQLR